MSVENIFEEARLLREVVAAIINHLAAGGHVVRNDRFFKDLKRVHRATRDLQQQMQSHPEYMAIEHWQNVACNLAFWAGMVKGRLDGPWSVVLDSMLETGGKQMTSVAITFAEQLGIELRESSDGGKSWWPIGAGQVALEQLRDQELLGELERRGRRFVEVQGLEPTPVRPGATLLDHLQAADADQDPNLAAAIELLAQQVPPELLHTDEEIAALRRRDRLWEHRCDVGDRLRRLPRGEQCGYCGERDPRDLRAQPSP